MVWCSDGFTPRKTFSSSGVRSNKSKCVCAKVYEDGSVQEASDGFNLVEYEGCSSEISVTDHPSRGSMIPEDDRSEQSSPSFKKVYSTRCNLKSMS